MHDDETPDDVEFMDPEEADADDTVDNQEGAERPKARDDLPAGASRHDYGDGDEEYEYDESAEPDDYPDEEEDEAVEADDSEEETDPAERGQRRG